jgi:protein-S-isoprenylcysteine O-methyltransferase Ste14
MNNSTEKGLARTAMIRTFGFSAFLVLLIIVPAGPSYWQGWLYGVVFSLCCVFVTLYFLQHDPALVERRLHAGARAEKEKSQQVIQAFMSVIVILLFVLPGIDHRFGWSHVPAFIAVVADAVVVLGFAIIFITFKANSHAAAIIDVAPGQRVVSTGPYAMVRHPMYLGATLLLLATPLALGSVWAIILAIIAVCGIVWRLSEEERYLSQHLPGYDDYCQMTRHRLVPFIW